MSNALLRGLDVLKCFSQERRSLTGSEIARLTDMPQPTAWRVCKVLEAQGYLVMEPDGRYRPGLAVLNLGFAALNAMNIAALAAPSLQALANDIGGTAGLSTPEGTAMLFLQRCEAPNAVLSYNMNGGVMVPIGNSASGWAYLALAPEEKRSKVLGDLRRADPTHAGVADKHLKAASKAFAQTGYVVNDEVFYPGLMSLAVPFLSNRRGSYYVVSCTAMKTHFHKAADLQKAGAQLQALAAQLVDL